jgi:putative membrane protein
MFICFGVGAMIAYFVTVMTPAQTPDALWFIFICGMVAVCALLLPGTSGAFMLLIMGKYQYILNALTEFKVAILAVFMGGAVVGMLSFSHFLAWLLRKYHDVTIALLSGFLFGSLNKIWPWKLQIDTVTGNTSAWNMENLKDPALNLIEKNLLPHTFEEVTKVDAHFYTSLAFAAVAVVLYLTIEMFAKRRKKTDQ